jgi:hypothetical protein
LKVGSAPACKVGPRQSRYPCCGNHGNERCTGHGGDSHERECSDSDRPGEELSRRYRDASLVQPKLTIADLLTARLSSKASAPRISPTTMRSGRMASTKLNYRINPSAASGPRSAPSRIWAGPLQTDNMHDHRRGLGIDKRCQRWDWGAERAAAPYWEARKRLGLRFLGACRLHRTFHADLRPPPWSSWSRKKNR